MTRKYELVYVVSPEASDDQVTDLHNQVDAIVQRDYPVIQGINLVIVVIIVASNLLVDLTYAMLDPRIRY